MRVGLLDGPRFPGVAGSTYDQDTPEPALGLQSDINRVVLTFFYPGSPLALHDVST